MAGKNFQKKNSEFKKLIGYRVKKSKGRIGVNDVNLSKKTVTRKSRSGYTFVTVFYSNNIKSAKNEENYFVCACHDGFIYFINRFVGF